MQGSSDAREGLKAATGVVLAGPTRKCCRVHSRARSEWDSQGTLATRANASISPAARQLVRRRPRALIDQPSQLLDEQVARIGIDHVSHPHYGAAA
jgi:hypothetical protein